MSRRIEKCHICKGTGLITVDDWLVKGMTEEQIEKKKEEALADVVEVVRCGQCVHRTSGKPSCQGRHKDWFCANGERR